MEHHASVRVLAAVSLIALVAGAQTRVPVFVHSSAIDAPAGQALMIEGEVSGAELSRVVVHARAPGGSWEDVELQLQYGDLFRGEIPGDLVQPPAVEYWVEGFARAGVAYSIFATAKQPVKVIVRGTATAPKPVERPRKKPEEPKPVEEPVRAEPEKKPVEPRAAPEPKPRAKPAQKSALEEELELYGAEAPSGIVQRVAESSQVSALSPTVLTNQDLKRLGARYVYDALELVPGVSVSRDEQGNWRVALRGIRAEPEVLITLNGQRLNNFYDAKALANLPVDNLERIEVFRGPATVDVGLGNVVGLINLVTRKDVGFRASASGGLYLNFDGHLNGAVAAGPVTLFGDADVAYQKGNPLPVTKDALDTSSATRTKSTNDQRLLVNAGLGVSIDLDSAGIIDASGRVLYEDRAALIGLFDVVGNDSRLQWLTVQAQAGWRKALDGGGQLSVRGWFNQQSTDRLFQLAPDGWTIGTNQFADGVLQQEKIGTRGFGLTARGDFALPFHNLLTAGLQLEHQSVFSAELLSNLRGGTSENLGQLVRPDGLTLVTENGSSGRGLAADRFGAGLFLSDTWTPVEIVTIQAGLRFDLTQLSTGFTPGFGPRVGLTVTPIKPLAFRASYGRSFRAPTPLEYAQSVPTDDFNLGRFVGSLSLQPAYLDALEAGVEYVQAIGDGKLRLRGNFFFERITNAVVAIDTTGNLTPYANRLLGVQALGLEGEARLELTSRFIFWLNVSWVRAEDLSTPTQSRLLTELPQVRANAGTSIPLGPWLNVDFVMRYASERRNNSRSVLELIRRYTLPGHATFTAQLRTEPLFGHVELIVLSQNVFNTEYADDATRPDRVTGGVPRARFNVFGQVKVSF